ncbi:Hypothetical protein MVR_LOCUS43 [uncultured virus]|nr:Hypothetical protein MVR_LOCUS43 [uncultured virus]
MHITNLNNAIILRIFALLPLASYLDLILTCQRFHKLVNDNQSLLKTWCINKFPKYITQHTPLPNGTDYKWLLKCSYFDITEFAQHADHKYGYIKVPGLLYIRSAISNSFRFGTPYVIEQGISFVNNNTTIFIGTFLNSNLQGYGTCIRAESRYAGEFINGQYHGLGTMTWTNDESYHGYFLGNYKSGYGTYNYTDGSCYTGQWYCDTKHGQGSYTWPNGSSYVGQFYTDKYNGLGTFTKCADNRITNTHFGAWVIDIPLGCDFGYLFGLCRDCNVKVCNDCNDTYHKKCKSNKTWSADDVVLNCGHKKQELSKIG